MRVHRRHGREERLLGDDEIRAWAGRVAAVAPALRGKGPVWVAGGFTPVHVSAQPEIPVLWSRAIVLKMPPDSFHKKCFC